MTTDPQYLHRRCADVAATCTANHLREATRAVNRIFDAALRPAGLRSTQFSLLVALEMSGAVTLSRLARITMTDRTTLTRNLVLVERSGFVTSDGVDDRRTRVVSLTPAGRKALRRALPLWEKAQARCVKALGTAEWRRLLTGLKGAMALGRAS